MACTTHRKTRRSADLFALAIETALTIRLVFHQPLRQTEGLLRSIADVLGVDIAIPDHTTLSRRGVGLTVRPKDIHRTEPLHLVVDSTGLKIYGEGEWLDAKHGSRSRRRWRKLHIRGGARITRGLERSRSSLPGSWPPLGLEKGWADGRVAVRIVG